MPDIESVAPEGSALLVRFDDGSVQRLYRTTTNLWLAGDGVPYFPPGGGDGGDDSLTLVDPLPGSFTGTTDDGTSVMLNATQILRLSQIVQYGRAINGVTRAAIVVACITVMVESSARNLSNTVSFPESASFPDIDGDGHDSDSIGMFQQRPSAGWGTALECATISHEVAAFFGGPDGPNFPSPAGLLDIEGWESMTPGEAAQAVQVSAFPDRYQNYVPFIDALLNVLLTSNTDDAVTWPFPPTTPPVTSEYGQRINPVTGQLEVRHDGIDFGEAAGTPINAIAAGTVVQRTLAPNQAYGNCVWLQHTFGGRAVTSFYGHMRDTPLVGVGDSVAHMEQIGVVGSTGLSTGPHLHFGTWDGTSAAQSVNPRVFMQKYGAVNP